MEQRWWSGPESCTATGAAAATTDELLESILNAPLVRCDEVPASLFGLSIAGWVVVSALALAALAAVCSPGAGERCSDGTAAGPTAIAASPGDPTPARRVARILRVDHAGEYGAKRIYEGQLAVLGETPAGPVIRDMAEVSGATWPRSRRTSRTARSARPCCCRSGTWPGTRWVQRARCWGRRAPWRARRRSKR